MRITELDKRRAIKRLPEFQKEYTRYKKFKTEIKKREFEVLFFKKWKFELLQIIHADEVAKYRKDGQSIEVINYEPAGGEISRTMLCLIYDGEERIQGNDSGEYLYLKISKANLDNKTEKLLIQDFRNAISPYRKLLTENRSRGTDIEKGLWPVYDLYISTGNNMNETTRKWFKVIGNPAPLPNENEFDEKLLKQIQQAVRNAETIINAVRQEYDLKPIKILKGTP
jgi:hypothetical protein